MTESTMQKLLDTIRLGVEFAEGLSPVIGMIPGAGAIATTAINAAGAVMEVVTNVQERIAEGTIVANSEEQAVVKSYYERLEEINDGLAAYIDQT